MTIAIIGGTALADIPGLSHLQEQQLSTIYGEPSSPLFRGTLNGRELIFLPRHGVGHNIAPHKINYRANICALKDVGVTQVVALASVGGITQTMSPGTLAVPDQLIDYTYDRQHTFFEDNFSLDQHIDFTYPYTASLRQQLLQAATTLNIPMRNTATYAVTQGPRLETAAEIKRLARDGCDLVGMTGMPEAALAREAGMDYACCAIVVNWAAGVSESLITLQEIKAVVAESNNTINALLASVITQVGVRG